MPFTPFHFGIGALTKGIAPERVSFSAFVVSQVVIDVEPAYYLWQPEWPVHRWCHTLVGAVPIGLLSGLATSAVMARLPSRFWVRLGLRPARSEMAAVPAMIGGLLGGATHPVLDAVMHWDVAPLRPLVASNPLLGWIGLPALHLACVIAAGVGIGLLILRGGVSSVLARQGAETWPGFADADMRNITSPDRS